MFGNMLNIFSSMHKGLSEGIRFVNVISLALVALSYGNKATVFFVIQIFPKYATHSSTFIMIRSNTNAKLMRISMVKFIAFLDTSESEN